MAKKFLTDINIAGGVYDSSGDIGSSGQVLSSTGSGINWIDANSAASVVYQDGFTGNGSTTAFTLANSIDNENKTQVYIDGVYQHKDNYSLSGTTLTFSTAPPNTSDIEVISFSTVSSADDILYDTDFGSAGLMKTNGSGVYSIVTDNSSNWNTAYAYSQVGHLPLAGGTLTGTLGVGSNNINFDDGGRARFGNSSDMQIYHDGSNSIIEEHGDGNLYIRGANQVRLQGSNQSNLFIGNQGGSVGLYHNNSAKIETASYGAQIINLSNTTATSDTADKIKIGTFGSGRPAIFFDTSNTTYTNRTWFIENIGHAGKLRFGRNGKDIMEIFNDGNIYMSDNLGIGTTSPAAKLTIQGTNSANGGIKIQNSGGNPYGIYSDNNDLLFTNGNGSTTALTIAYSGNATFAGDVYVTGTTNSNVVISRDNMYLDAGQFYIGADDSVTDDSFRQRTASGSYFIESRKSGTWTNRLQINSAGTLIAGQGATFAGTIQSDDITIVDGTNDINLYLANTSYGIQLDYSAGDMFFRTNGGTRLTIANGGNVGIGVTSPNAKLSLAGGSNINSQNSILYIDTNSYYASGADRYITSSTAARYFQLNGEHIWSNAVSGTAGNAISFTERMRIDTSGVVSVATGNLRLDGTAKLYTNNDDLTISSDDNGNGSSGRIMFRTVNQERMRIDNDGLVVLKSMSVNTTRNLVFEGDSNSTSGNAGAIGMFADGARLTSNYYYSGSQAKYVSGNGQAAINLQTGTTATGTFMSFAINPPADAAGVTERMRIDSSGKVGIGRTDPNARLDIKGAGGGTGLTFETSDASNNQTFYIQDGGRAGLQYWPFTIAMGSGTSAATSARFQVATTGGDFVILNDGKTGIGTTSPGAKLHVVDGNNYAQLGDLQGNSTMSLRMADNAASPIEVQAYGTELRFNTSTTSGATPSVKMNITSAGNVGIGTTSPDYQLDIENSSHAVLRLHAGVNSSASLRLKNDAQDWDLNTQTTDTFAIYNQTSGTQPFSILTNGNVGIGTTSPGKLFSVVGADGRNSTTYLAEFVNNDNTSDQGHGVLIDGGNNANHHLFQVNAQNSAVFAVKGNGYVGIGITSPQTNLQVNGSPNGIVSHFGPGTNNGNGTWSAISLGYSEAGNAGYRKVGIATQTKGDGAARQDLHFLVDTASDSNSINISDSKMSIQYNTGDVIINNNLGIGTTAPRAKLEVNGELIAKDIKHSNFSVSSLSTTGYTIATVTGGGNGQSAQIEFVGMGGTSGIVDVVYSCTNQGGNWYAYKKARQTPTIVDVDVTGHGTTTLSFIFKSLSGTAGYTPRLMMKGSPSALVTF